MIRGSEYYQEELPSPQPGREGDGFSYREDAQEGVVLFHVCGSVSHVEVGSTIERDLRHEQQ